MTTSGDAVIEVLDREEEDEVSEAKNGGGWPANRLRGRAREHLKGLYLWAKRKSGGYYEEILRSLYRKSIGSIIPKQAIMIKSALQQARSKYSPKLPKAL